MRWKVNISSDLLFHLAKLEVSQPMSKIITIILLALPAFSFAQSEVKCSSPDNRIVFYFKLKADQPTYRITFKGSELLKGCSGFIDGTESY
jgi:hypothetical protein